MSGVTKKPSSGQGRRGHMSARRTFSSKNTPGRPSRPGPKRGSSGRPAGPTKPDSRKPAGKDPVMARRVSRRRPAVRRPSARAEVRRAAIAKRPMPNPPKRRVVSAKTPTPAARVSDELLAEVKRIQDEFADLEANAQLSSVYNAIGDFDAKLVELPMALEALRDRGYVHSGQIDDQLEALDDQWDKVRPRVESALRENIRRLDRELDGTERQVNNLKAEKAAIRSADSAISSLSSRVDAAREAVEGLYEGMESNLYQISYAMDTIRRMMDLLDESPEIRLYEAEGPLLAVQTKWQRDGKEGPEGILFLTDQRLMFEQREEVVTKKVFGIFKKDSEETQDLLLDIQVAEIESVSDKEEGGFLGMGKDDILELVFAPTSPVSRTRFHIKGQDSKDWAAMIKRIQTGEIDGDREDEYVEELREAETTAASFPTNCPNCFAEVPTPPRGVSRVTCEFCGAEINA